MNYPDVFKAVVPGILSLFPEVKWDRMAGEYDKFAIYGWIDRPDGKKDFVILIFDDLRVSCYLTSSSKLSPEIGRRLGFDSNHKPCVRVEHLFPDIDNVIRL